jgi:hypothetical protein
MNIFHVTDISQVRLSELVLILTSTFRIKLSSSAISHFKITNCYYMRKEGRKDKSLKGRYLNLPLIHLTL